MRRLGAFQGDTAAKLRPLVGEAGRFLETHHCHGFRDLEYQLVRDMPDILSARLTCLTASISRKASSRMYLSRRRIRPNCSTTGMKKAAGIKSPF
jgi:hypothetical protein